MRFLRILALVGSVAVPLAAHADDDDHRDADRARRGALAGEIMPLADLARIVQQRYPGRLVEAELDEDDGIPVYEIRMLQGNGRVVELEVDARDARILDVDIDDD